MEIAITPHALLTVHTEFTYLKEFATERAARKFKNGFVEKVDSILPQYLAYPECRFLPTKNNIYRNIIWGNYLIIYKVLKKEVLVLGVFHSKQNPAKLKAYRKVKK
ncbi:MAG: type II toxin-antitoxin system RelE/ParE family toxin [Chitinophagales bacterium]